MSYNTYPRGSEWRRWDLHLHTPETKKNDQFEGRDTDEKWSNFCETINHYSDEVSVVGITDYLSVDNYFKFNQFLGDGKIAKLIDLVIPNVELRILPATGTANPINIHCLFNPSIASDLNDRFFAKLKFSYGGSDFSASRSELARLGRNYSNNQQLSEQEAFSKGVGQYVVEFKNLKNIFSEDPDLRENTIVIVSNSNQDGASGLNHASFFENGSSQLDATRQAIYQFSDAIFSANPRDRTYFLGLGVDNVKSVIHKCRSLKPCFHGSDAHENSKTFAPDFDRFCWVKGDPTFEGFKQVLYEPEQRVFISEEKPDDKRLYHVIDKVKFIDTNFSTQEILLNPNLSAIIGGKSTGKSILLRNIAKTVDDIEFRKRLKTIGLSDSRPLQGMEVYWSDGQVSSLGSVSNPPKRIIYIPQSYLNRVVDEEKKNTDIDDIIREVLLQDETFKEWSDTLVLKEKKIDNAIENNIRNLFDNLEAFNENSQALRKIGDQKGVKEQIKKIVKEIEEVQSKLKLSTEEISSYNEQIEKIKNQRLEISNLREDLKKLERTKALNVFLDNSIDLKFETDQLTAEFSSIWAEKGLSYITNWTETVDRLINRYKEVLVGLEKSQFDATVAIKSLQEKVDSQQGLSKKYIELEEEQKREKNIEVLNKKKEEARSEIDKAITDLSELSSEYFTIYLEAKDIINLDSLDDELIFDIQTVFQDQAFSDNFIKTYFDGRSISKVEFDYLNQFNFTTKEDFKIMIDKVIRNILMGNLPMKDKEHSPKATITALTRNWFVQSYKVEYQGDQINEMSPGKKSFVLLRLLVDLDNSQCPILIDQPEDDLDNRSIYNEVVKFLRRRKSERQIIIATHNPNLVLGADAELVIVANQDGKDTKNKTSKFEYVAGGIEHKFENEAINEVLYKKGIQEHICDILEGGEEAFIKRKSKYSF